MSGGGQEGTDASERKEEGREAQGKDAALLKKTELSEEDKQLMEVIEMLVERVEGSDVSLHQPALEALRVQIRTSAATMTSIPKALKFLRLHFDRLVQVHVAMAAGGRESACFLADILSVMAMTFDAAQLPRATLKYRLLGRQHEPIGDWGHEYVRHLAMEIAAEHAHLVEANAPTAGLEAITREAAAFFLDHNAEPDACDLLYETERLGELPALLDGTRDHERVCLYLQSCVPLEASPDDQIALRVAREIYRRTGGHAQALVLSLRLNSPALVAEVFESCADPLAQKQLALMLGRARVVVATEDETLAGIMRNSCLGDRFRALLAELEIAEPKTPEDVYKSHLQESLRVLTTSAKTNLAAVFVNGFVNAGSSVDRLVTADEALADDAKSLIFKNKDAGMLSAVASIGLIDLWNAEKGLEHLDRYLGNDNVHVRAGAVLGIGLVHTGTHSEQDAAWALLREYLADASPVVRTSALMGLALAYAGSGRTDLAETLIPHVGDHDLGVGAMAALALGHVFVGTANGEIASVILQTLMERDSEQLGQASARFFSLALALLFLGRQEAEVQTVLETLQAIEHPIGRESTVLVQVCAYLCTGNVLKVQELLHICNEQQATGREPVHVTYAVLGVALAAMAEDIGREMALRIFGQLMHYGEPSVRKAVPLALGLLYASNPTASLLDTLSKQSHDHDKAVAVNAIFGMGLASAGTNNAKVAQMLRQLAAYYQRDPDCLYAVRIAQALVHMGKGTMTLSPLHAHRSVASLSGVAGLLSVAIAFSDAQTLMLDSSPYLLYYLVPAMYPRFLWTLDEHLHPFPVLVRVGQAVDVVGQAGKPKTITGFQTHTTPVLLANNERAEFATEQCKPAAVFVMCVDLPVSPILEGFVIVKPNPEWREDEPIKRK